MTLNGIVLEYQEKATMDMKKKRCLLLVPFIFIIILFIPGMIREIITAGYLKEMSDTLWNIFITIECPLLIIWALLFFYIPTVLYIVLAAVYTVISWICILRKKEGSVLFFIVWLILCIVSILLYWKLRWLYYGMITG